MAKTAIIEDIPNVREWQGNNGTVYYLQLVLDNGDTGSIGKKTKDALKIGDSITYEIEQTDKGNKIKEVKENTYNANTFRNGQPQSKDASFALSYAKDVTVAMIQRDLIPNEKMNSTDIAKGTIHIANEFLKWLKDN